MPGTLAAKLLHEANVPFDGLTGFVREALKEFVADRNPGEPLSDYWGRTRPQTEVDAAQFHLENASVPA
jgi:hypothetical protein